MTQKDKELLLKAIEQKRQEVRPTNTGEMKPATVPNNLELGWLNALKWMEDLINSLSAEQPNFKVEFAGKVYEVVRVRELSNGTTMYGILDEPNHIDYINKDNCRLVKPSENLDVEINLEYKSNYKLKELTLEEFRTLVYHFTNWQKEQMMKGLCLETKVYRDEEGDGIDTPIESWLALENNEIMNLPDIGLRDGDKVKVIIVKEDEQ